MILNTSQHFKNYEVKYAVKRGDYAETYHVRDDFGRNAFLKLIDREKLQSAHRLDDGSPREVTVARQLNQRNLCKCLDGGSGEIGGRTLDYVVTELVSGEDLAKRLRRDTTLTVYETKQIAMGVLEALQHLHTLPSPVTHNAIIPEHVMLDMSDDPRIHAILVNMGQCTPLDAVTAPPSLDTPGFNPFFLAPERWEGHHTVQSDIYMVGALIYRAIFGLEPWHLDLSRVAPSLRQEVMLAERKSPLKMLNINLFELDETLMNIMAKALAYDPKKRFSSAAQMLDALKGNIHVEPQDTTDGEGKEIPQPEGRRRGNGFADVAGMSELKDMLTRSVINILRNIERAKKYKLTIPNGMLLYGPPGCGKSFIAEKFAEETGYNYMYVKSSDLASIYIHGTQEKIGNLFDEARKKAPTILCFDEFDALVPNRSENYNNVAHNSEVNEFLSQLNNCGKDGVFVIASTNKPNLIDKAVLRRGRIDKIIYVPLPDLEARAGLFEIHLKGRPLASDVNYERLAALTQNYVSSDIAYIVNEAATLASERDADIDQHLLEDTVRRNKPSVSPQQIKEFEALREKLSNEMTKERRSVGFL